MTSLKALLDPLVVFHEQREEDDPVSKKMYYLVGNICAWMKDREKSENWENVLPPAADDAYEEYAGSS